jgi:hypothetical protein
MNDDNNNNTNRWYIMHVNMYKPAYHENDDDDNGSNNRKTKTKNEPKISFTFLLRKTKIV